MEQSNYEMSRKEAMKECSQNLINAIADLPTICDGYIAQSRLQADSIIAVESNKKQP